MSEPRLLIIAHDPSPNLARLAGALLEGARGEAVEATRARHVRPLEAGPDDVLAADGLILCTPENLGYMSGALKDFFDRSYYACLDRTDALPYALVIRAGKDGTGTRRAVESIASGLNWKPVQKPLICHGQWQEGFIEQCRELGELMAVGLENDIF